MTKDTRIRLTTNLKSIDRTVAIMKKITHEEHLSSKEIGCILDMETEIVRVWKCIEENKDD